MEMAPASGNFKTGNRSKQRRLAAAGGSQKRKNALFEFETDVIQGSDVLERFDQPFDLQNSHT